jgi:hypothetical protein
MKFAVVRITHIIFVVGNLSFAGFVYEEFHAFPQFTAYAYSPKPVIYPWQLHNISSIMLLIVKQEISLIREDRTKHMKKDRVSNSQIQFLSLLFACFFDQCVRIYITRCTITTNQGLV